jgi:hypothetical protein
MQRPLPDPPRVAGREKNKKRKLDKRVEPKPDGRYLIYYKPA